jgi:AmmeMemoRadiSam system protein B
MNRQPAVAGTFYPANPQQLQQIINRLLDNVQNQTFVPKAIIAPHAGLIYSGAIAASAYSRLLQAHDTVTRVILIGPSHRVSFNGLAISKAESFSTPLGKIAIDFASVNKISSLPFVDYIEQAHIFEHCLEVQLPFLQIILDNFTIVPIVVGDASVEQVSSVLKMLWGGMETLIVISSDLSHYHDYETAQIIDQKTSENIESLQYEALNSESACGKIPVSGLLALAREKSLSVKTIDLRNSGDTAGDKNRVVGYGAYVIEE